MEEGGDSRENTGKKMTEEEMLAEIQAAEDIDGEGEEETEEDSLDQLDEEDQKIYEAITKENMRNYLAEATAFRMNKNFNRACQILKIILSKGEVLYGSALHIELATYYYMMGI